MQKFHFKRIFFFLQLIVIVLVANKSVAQDVYVHISNTAIYELLDELANDKIITVNSAIKPYTRKFISAQLQEALKDSVNLTKRQRADVKFYLKDYNKELLAKKTFKKRLDIFFYKDSNFTFSINPILGYQTYRNANGTVTHRYNGAEAYSYIGKHIAMYGSLRDNGVNKILFASTYLTQMQGAAYKLNQGQEQLRKDFSEARGGVSIGNKLGSIGIYKDHFVWGNNYNGANIFSGRQPSFGYIGIKLHPTKWFEFNYINAYLVSNVLDSGLTYGNGPGTRKVFHPKNLTTNMFTFKPIKHLQFSFGNSIIYSDVKFNPAYLLPFAFYKSVDHTYNSAGSNALGQNSQLFFDISTRNIKHVHLYSSVFVDEISIGNMLKPSKQTNLVSAKVGARVNNVIKNVSFIVEYTRTRPWVYSHPISTTTFESNHYNLGHYLGQNAEEIYGSIIYKPRRGLIIQGYALKAKKGPEYSYKTIKGSINVPGTVFMSSVDWKNTTVGIKIRYELLNDIFVFLDMNSATIQGNVYQYTSSFYWNNPNTTNIGINWGF